MEERLIHTTDASDDATIPNLPGYKLYWSRWWILIVFSLFTMMQSCIWITFSPITTPSMNAYGTSLFEINMLVGMGALAYFPCSIPTSWLIDKKGLKFVFMISVFLLLIASGIRCFASDHSTYWIIIAAQMLNACLGPAAMTIPPKLSAVWFAVNERTTSTAISGLSNWFGSAIGFLMGFMVPSNGGLSDVRKVLYLQTLICGITFLAAALHFPDHPPTAPSSSQEKKTSENSEHNNRTMWSSFKSIIVDINFLIIVIAGGLSAGIYGTWSALFDATLSPMGYSQEQSAWLGFISTISGIVGGILIGKFADRWSGHYKWITVFLFVAATGSFAWFALQANHVLPVNFVLLCVSVTLAGLFLLSAVPLFYEMAVEVTYPFPEAISSGVLMFVNNIGNISFVFATAYLSSTVINWLMCGSTLVFSVFLLFLREDYKRNLLDTGYAYAAIQ